MLVQVARRAHARHHVLALGVRQEVPRRRGLARDLVAREGHARARAVALVAEHHLLHVHRRAPVVRDVVDAAVLDRALPGPGVEHGRDRLAQLLLRVLRERLAGLLLEELLEALRERLQVVHVELHVLRHAGVGLLLLDQLLVALARDAAADVPEHLDEAPVGVPGEALVVGGPARGPRRTRRSGPGSGPCRACRASTRVRRCAPTRAAGRPGRRAACPPAPRAARGRRDLVVRHPAGLHVRHAGLGRDREAGRHALGAEHARHLGDVRALPPSSSRMSREPSVKS